MGFVSKWSNEYFEWYSVFSFEHVYCGLFLMISKNCLKTQNEQRKHTYRVQKHEQSSGVGFKMIQWALRAL